MPAAVAESARAAAPPNRGRGPDPRPRACQDRASCFPAHVLMGLGGGRAAELRVVIDACAAPGNKATHLAALLAAQPEPPPHGGTVVAVERDAARLALLRRTARRASAGAVRVVHGDWLGLPVDALPQSLAEAVLVDVSCSGSGTRADVPEPRGGAGSGREERTRLAKLSSFQLR